MTKDWQKALCLQLAAVCACGDQVGAILPTQDAAEIVEVSGDVVSSVNGSAIVRSEVEHLARVGELPLETALARLQAERLLSQEAAQRGYGRTQRTREVARKAEVQALLEDEVEVDEVTQVQVEEAYEAQRARFEQPEKRAAVHVLAKPTEAEGAPAERAARAFIAQTLRALQAAGPGGVAPILAAARGESSSMFSVSVEELPVAARSAYVPEFSDALFSLQAPGVVPDAVRTQFGYHAIVLRQVTPAVHTAQSVAFATLRDELAAMRHKARFDALLEQLRRHTTVRWSGDTQKLLAALDF